MTALKNNIFFFVLWISSFVFSQQEILKTFSKANGLPETTIIDITQDNIGFLWLATAEGLFRFDGDNFEKINNKATNNLFFNNKKMFAGVENGLIIIENEIETYYESKKVIFTTSIDDVTYFGTEQGIYYFNETYLQPISISTKLDFSIIYNIQKIDDSFYIASNTGLWVLENLMNPQNIIQLINEPIIDLEIYESQLIAISKNTLSVISDKKIRTTINILNNSIGIQKIDNQLWIYSTTDGIEILSLPSFSFQQKMNKYNFFNTDNIQSVFNDKNNAIWIAFQNQLVLLEPVVKKINQEKPEVFFQELKINYKNATDLLSYSKLQLQPDENTLSISYKTVHLTQPKSVFYQYLLNGVASEWTQNNTLQLANLNYGNYVIEIQSRIDDKKSDVKKISFTIQKPFYYNIYFLVSVFLVLLLIIYLIVNYQIKNIKTKNQRKVNELVLKNKLQELQQKALQLQMNPHFIFNVLNGIKALGNSNNKEELNEVISQFSNLLRSILNNSRKEEITLEEEIVSLKNYLELEKKMNSKKFDYEFVIDIQSASMEEILLPTMLLQPFIENSIKHGLSINKIGLIKVQVQEKNNYIGFEIIDNGVGFSATTLNIKNKTHQSVALNLTQERLSNLTKHHCFTISTIKKDHINSGTKISFKIPLKTDY